MSALPFANCDGKIVDSSQPYLTAENRAFRYGDGLFESIRVINGKVCFPEVHIARLLEGMAAIKMDIPAHFTQGYFIQQLNQTIEANKVTEGARVRLTVFRNNGGFYQPEDNGAGFVIEMSETQSNYYRLNEDGLAVDLYTEIKKPVNKLSIYKTCNSLQYITSAIWARQNKLDDALIVNDKGNIIEASSSNLFIICNGVLYTPALSDGCLAGTMRMQVINLALENKIKVYECSLTPQNLLVADEIFLTSATRGLQWVSSYKMKRYFNTLTRTLVEKLNEKISKL